MEVKRVFDILQRIKTYAPKRDTLNAKINGEWVSYSDEDFRQQSAEVASSLAALGVMPGDRVAIMSANLPQWNFVDYGCQYAGVITIPIFPTISGQDLLFILQHSKARMIFVSDAAGLKKLLSVEKELPDLEKVFSFKPLDGIPSFEQFLSLGRHGIHAEEVQRRAELVNEHDVFTVLYTSGTTGRPKGVMITHHNMIANLMVCRTIAPFTTKWRALSFLPLNHVYERFLNILYLHEGVSIYYAESIESIGDNCREIQPQLFVAVPRVLERVLEKITATGEKLTGMKRRIFDWSMSLAEKFELQGRNGLLYELQRRVADKLVYSKWREAVGGKLILIVSGGAALNPRLERIFTCAKLTLLQGYGLTETSVVVAVNRFEEENRSFGTVGPVVENTQVRIASEDGEILVKGPSVMKGYYLDEAATREVMTADGWFRTGDIGKFEKDRFLKITDRKKEIFKTSAGKYISPVHIENKIKESRYVEMCMVIGDGQKFASALILPDRIAFKDHCDALKISFDPAEMIRHPLLAELIAAHMKEVNKGLASYEQIRRYRLVEGPWTVEGGEITPKLSLKRKNILNRYAETVKEIFNEE